MVQLVEVKVFQAKCTPINRFANLSLVPVFRRKLMNVFKKVNIQKVKMIGLQLLPIVLGLAGVIVRTLGDGSIGG